MSTYMGYDPSALRSLRDAMMRAELGLDMIIVVDPEAASAMRTVSAARTLLSSQWGPFIDGLFGCRAMTGYTPVTMLPADVRLSLLASHSGWTFDTDPGTSADAPMHR